MNRAVPYKNILLESLKNPVQAAAYLKSVAEDGDIYFLLKALRNVVEAQGGFTKLARKTKLNRGHLYKALSKRGNPEITTLESILNVFGLQIGFLPLQHRKDA